MTKTVLVTGASRGIGAAVAYEFGQAGYRVIVNCKSSFEEAKSLVEKMHSDGIDAEFIGADVAEFSAVSEMIEKIGNIDVLVNNAGISLVSLITDTTSEDWRKVIAADLDSVYNCTHAALPQMIKQKSGVIINISSMWGVTGASCEVAYSAAKSGVIGFTKALAKEVGPSGIRVNCVAPGVIDTAMNAELTDADKRALIEETPLGRIGTPQDIAKTVLFLASDDASFITGQVITVDGGLTV